MCRVQHIQNIEIAFKMCFLKNIWKCKKPLVSYLEKAEELLVSPKPLDGDP